MAQLAAAADDQIVVLLLDLHAHLLQLCGDAVHVLGDDAAHADLSARGGNGRHVGACLDLVGDDGVGAAVQALHARDADGVGAGALDVRAHGVEEVGEIDDVRLLRRIFDDGRAVRQSRGHHDVHGRADGDHVEINVRALHAPALGGGADVVALAHGRTHGGKALDVLVDGAGAAEVAAAGHGDLGLAEAAKQCADEIVARAQLVRQLLRGAGGDDVAAVKLHVAAVEHANLRTELLENLQQHGHVADLGDILDAAHAVHQKGGGQDSNSGVFRAADMDFAEERGAALNDILGHEDTSLLQYFTGRKAAVRRGRDALRMPYADSIHIIQLQYTRKSGKSNPFSF